MQKLFLFMLAAALCLTACGSEEAPQETSNQTGNSGVEAVAPPNAGINNENGLLGAEDCKIVAAGVTLEIGADFLPNVDVIGEARIEEGQACLEGGYDTNYYYGDSLAIYTYAKDGKQIIYDIYITGAEYTTSKGAKVGQTTKDEIHEIYGAATTSFPTSERYQVEGSDIVITFVFADNVLESIDILDSGVNN